MSIPICSSSSKDLSTNRDISKLAEPSDDKSTWFVSVNVHVLSQSWAVANLLASSVVRLPSLQVDTVLHLSSPDLLQESRLSNSSLNEMDGCGGTVPEPSEITISSTLTI